MGVIDDIYEGGGAKPVSWPEVGQTVEGVILQIRSKQLKKFGSETQLETWDSGEAKMTPVITLQTDEQDNEDDDGKRDIYLRSNAYTAFGAALRDAYKTKPTDSDLIGATLKLQYFKQEKSGKGQPRKLFRARITPKQHGSDAWEDASPRPAGTVDPDAPVNAPAKPANGGRPTALPPVNLPAKLEDDIPF